MHITFLVYRLDKSRLLTTEFYRQDIEILQALGYDVTVATRLREIPRNTDLVFLWWWNWLWLIGPFIKLRGLPICVTGSLEPDIYEKKPWYYRLLVRFGVRFADRSVFVSRYMIARLEQMMRLKNYFYCPHIVMNEYQLGSQDNIRALPQVVFNVAWKKAANVKRKMLPELIEAFALAKKQLPHIELHLAGEPMDGQDQLKQLAKKLGVVNSVKFLGKISKEAKIHYMQNCGAYYQCSRHEGFGLAIAEAMACGAPVIVNNKTAIPEVVGDCGYYVKDETPEQIAASLVEALSRADASRELGKRAAHRIDIEFRIERRKKFLKDILQELPLSKSACGFPMAEKQAA